MTKYIRFVKGTFGNDADDVVEVEMETEGDYYYTDGFDRWCYIEKDSPSIVPATAEEFDATVRPENMV